MDTWIYLLRDSRASHILSRDSAAEKLTNVISGQTPLESFAKLDPLSCSLKMSLDSLPKPTGQDIYLAGLIDGEGTISIWGKPGKQYYPVIQVGMSEKALPLLRELAESYGGKVRRFRPATSAWSAGWIWSIFGAEVRAILERIHSSLRLKKAHATLALRLFILIEQLEAPAGKRKRWTTEAREDASALATMMKELNKKGPEEIGEMVKNHPVLNLSNIWVTPQIDFLGMHQSFTGSFPKSGMIVSGTAYRLRPLVPRTSVGAGGVLPTPTGAAGNQAGANTKRWDGQNTLIAMAKTGMWPPPKGSPEHYGQPRENDRGDLQAAVKKWPPPTSSMTTMADMEQARFAGNDPKRSAYREAFWRTPSATETHGGPQSPEKKKAGGHAIQLIDQVGGQLNPRFVEFLMGIPQGWVSLDPLSLEAYQRWLQGNHWVDGEWEGVPRVATGIEDRVGQLRALGNGVVPAVVAKFLTQLTAGDYVPS